MLDDSATPLDLPDYTRRPDPTDPPERLMLVVRRVEDGAYLLVHRGDADRDLHDDVDGDLHGEVDGTGEEMPAPILLSTMPPHHDEGFDAGIASLLHARLGVRVVGRPRTASTQHPVRMAHPYKGGESLGLLRAVAVEVSGEIESDALVTAVAALDDEEAWAALATDLERAVFRDGVELLG